MPAFMPPIHHESRKRDGAADRSVVDDFSRCLQARTKKRVGRAADAKAARIGGLQNSRPFVAVYSQGLLSIGVLARLQGCNGNLRMGSGNCQIEDQID